MATRTHLLAGAIALGTRMRERLSKAYSLIFVGLITLGNSVYAQVPTDFDVPVVIGLKCATENSGVLEGLSVDKSKTFYRIQLRYEDSKPTILKFDRSSTGKVFTKNRNDIDVRTELDERNRTIAAILIKGLESRAAVICQGTTQSRDEALKKFEANRTAYGVP